MGISLEDDCALADLTDKEISVLMQKAFAMLAERQAREITATIEHADLIPQES